MSKKNYGVTPKDSDVQTYGAFMESYNTNFNTGKPSNCSYNPECAGNEVTGEKFFSGECNKMERLQFLDEQFPSLRPTVSILLNLMMSQALTSEDESHNELKKFLNQRNIQNDTNYEVLLEGLAHALIYQRCGFRFLSKNDGLVFYPADRYSVVYSENENYKGFYEIEGYIVCRPNAENTYSETFKNESDMKFQMDLVNNIGFNDNYLYLNKDQFYNFHFFGDELNPDSPLLHDRGRIDLFLQLIANIAKALEISNSDLNLVQLKTDLLSMRSAKASDVVAESKTNRDKKKTNFMTAVNEFANKIAKGTKQRVLVVPPTVDKFEKIENNINVSDFLKLYDYLETFIKNIYGLSNNVVTLEKMPRDASANPIFEQMMKTSIYPKRTILELFYNSFLKKNVGFKEDVRFADESYALGVKVQNAQAVANVISTLTNAELEMKDESKNLANAMIFDKLLKEEM